MRPLRHLTAVSVAFALGLAGCSSAAPGADAGTATAPPAANGTPSATADQPGAHHHGEGSAAPGQPNGPLVVYADEQLRATFTLLADKFEAAFPGTEIVFTFGASDDHARLLVAGALADVFASGAAASMAAVVDRGAARGKPTVIARNPLVIVTGAKADEVGDLAGLGRSRIRVVLCAQRTRCGDTARKVTDVRPALVRPDGKAAVAAVRSGAADATVVYRTDVVQAGADVRAIDFPQGVAHADQYAVVPLDGGRNRVASDAFVAFINSALAKRALSEAGFSPA